MDTEVDCNADSTGIETWRAKTRASGEIRAGASASGDAYAPALETTGTRSTGAEYRGARFKARRVESAVHIAPRAKHRTAALLRACVDSLDRARDNAADFFLRNNSLEQVKDALKDLWDMRRQREQPYAAN